MPAPCSKGFGVFCAVGPWLMTRRPMWAGRGHRRLLGRNPPHHPAFPAAVRQNLAWLPRFRRSNEAWLMLHPPSRSKRTPRGILLLTVVALAPQSIQAQAPPDRTQLERFRDSLASTSDSTGLLSLEKRLIDSTKTNRSDGLLHLRLGFLSLRLGEMGGHSH